MSSPGTGADISPEDARDLLQKMISESTRVQGVSRGTNSITAGVIGVLVAGPDGTLMVKPGSELADPFLIFDPRLATSFKYGDRRAFPPTTPLPGAPIFDSALSLIYPDQSIVVLFEIAPLAP